MCRIPQGETRRPIVEPFQQILAHADPDVECRRKVEMSPVAQSRNDAPIGDGHDEPDLGCIPAVKVEQRI